LTRGAEPRKHDAPLGVARRLLRPLGRRLTHSLQTTSGLRLHRSCSWSPAYPERPGMTP